MQLGFLLLNPFQVTAFTITRHESHIYYFTRFNRNCSKHSIETRKSFLLPCIIPWHIGVKNIICWCCTIKYFLDGCSIKCLFSFNNFFYSRNSFIVILTVIGFGMFISVLNLLIPSWPWLSDRMVYTIFWLISKHLFTLVEVKKSWINLQLRVAHFIYNNDASPCFFPCFHHKPVNVGHTSDRKVHTKNITKNIGINNTVSRYVFLLIDWCYFNTLNFRRRYRKFLSI